ncbi:conserved hypothetical protein [Histoplasma capsulatum var. duboisii H88]|uniref:HNH nuclease domain-containing protein n=1 Tax=Ajellomyces capsulatus (strain H88) TaxID=544711 RepID=F0UGU4_AJEC8|nr:conserved hypothetical protein [Histoplasma capsulatum var. duboisii H88]QSS55952.1 hypothetical protein I7I53_03983 [Histoplasma capsulatum var. duboisii H88]
MASTQESAEDVVDSFFNAASRSASPPPPVSQLEEDTARMKISAYKPQSLNDNTSSILTTFLDNLPQEGKQNLIPFIATCEDDEILFTLSQHLKSVILLSLRARTTPYVTPSPLPGAENLVNVVSSQRTRSSDRNSQGKLKKQCLARDGYRCLVTGAYDYEHAAKNAQDDFLETAADTELAHIIPFALGKFRSNAEETQKARVWAAIYTCFPDVHFRTNCSAGTVNDYENLMTLLGPIHAAFGKFQLAFEPADEENTYYLRLYHYRPYMMRLLPEPDENNERVVKFTKHADYELPSRVLLSTHAAVARIQHATGMARTIDQILRDREELSCLAEDGSTDIGQIALLAY